MYINQAIEQAVRQKKGITRKSWMPRELTLIPTNTISGIAAVQFTSYKKIKSNIMPNWQPVADDLTADDWVVQD